MGGQIPSTESAKSAEAPADSQGSAGGSSPRGRDFGRSDNSRGGFNRGAFGGGFSGRSGNGGGSTSSELTVVGNGDGKKMEFHFKNTPWPDVIQLFAEKAGYTLVMESPPRQWFNYDDSTLNRRKKDWTI